MKNEKMFILPFDGIRAIDLPLVGGKGTNLGELIHAGYPVSPRFCLKTVVFQQFIDACPDSADLYALLATVMAMMWKLPGQ